MRRGRHSMTSEMDDARNDAVQPGCAIPKRPVSGRSSADDEPGVVETRTSFNLLKLYRRTVTSEGIVIGGA